MLYLYVMLIAYAALSFTCATLILALASDASHVAKAHRQARQARLFRAQEKWAELMDQETYPAACVLPTSLWTATLVDDGLRDLPRLVLEDSSPGIVGLPGFCVDVDDTLVDLVSHSSRAIREEREDDVCAIVRGAV